MATLNDWLDGLCQAAARTPDKENENKTQTDAPRVQIHVDRIVVVLLSQPPAQPPDQGLTS